jgi:hypothetical protein
LHVYFRAEFLDELLDSQEQQENFAGEAITQQPGSLYTAKDINKILHVQGVKLYADMWSESEVYTTPFLFINKINVACYKLQRLSTSHMQQSGVEMDTTNSAETSLTGSQFQSCYSHFNRSFHRPHPSCL